MQIYLQQYGSLARRHKKEATEVYRNSGLRIKRRRQKFKCEEYKLKNINYNRMRNNNRGGQNQQT